MRTLVLGGYGNFGARICRALSARNIEVIAAGRNPERGHIECGFDERIGSARLDIHVADFATALRKLAPEIVIHCVGPYQGQSYDVARAALLAGAHYIDLADGRDFVRGFAGAIDESAIKANRLAVTGASTLPALSSAVIDSLVTRFIALEEIQVSIAPAQRSPRGAATLKAVFSYLGRPFTWLSKGEQRQVYGWQAIRRLTFHELGTRWAAACDVPDLDLLPMRYPGIKTAEFRASLEFALEHLILSTFAGLRRLGVPLPIESWSAPMDRLAAMFNVFAGKKGGMLVSATGKSEDGKPVRTEWHLTADWSHGPEIPCLPAILIAERLARREIRRSGAIACMGLLKLQDFQPEFERLGIRTNIREMSL